MTRAHSSRRGASSHAFCFSWRRVFGRKVGPTPPSLAKTSVSLHIVTLVLQIVLDSRQAKSRHPFYVGDFFSLEPIPVPPAAFGFGFRLLRCRGTPSCTKHRPAQQACMQQQTAGPAGGWWGPVCWYTAHSHCKWTAATTSWERFFFSFAFLCLSLYSLFFSFAFLFFLTLVFYILISFCFAVLCHFVTLPLFFRLGSAPALVAAAARRSALCDAKSAKGLGP
eukprot:COSAG01_NODE_496_length_16290_cov_48.639244_8_plen_223_part_00